MSFRSNDAPRVTDTSTLFLPPVARPAPFSNRPGITVATIPTAAMWETRTESNTRRILNAATKIIFDHSQSLDARYTAVLSLLPLVSTLTDAQFLLEWFREQHDQINPPPQLTLEQFKVKMDQIIKHNSTAETTLGIEFFDMPTMFKVTSLEEGHDTLLNIIRSANVLLESERSSDSLAGETDRRNIRLLAYRRYSTRVWHELSAALNRIYIPNPYHTRTKLFALINTIIGMDDKMTPYTHISQGWTDYVAVGRWKHDNED